MENKPKGLKDMEAKSVWPAVVVAFALSACGGGSEGESTGSDVPGLSNVAAYFDDPDNATGVGSLDDICEVWNLGVSGEQPGYDDGARDTLRALITLRDQDWASLTPGVQDEAMTIFLTDNC